MPTSMSAVIHYVRSAVLLEGQDRSDGQLLESFVSRCDTAALEALVRRHGPMVWGVCRRVLGNQHDAEDAFQATFLVLLRKAGSITAPAKVGCWLWGVAYQTALKARAARAKRRVRERPVNDMPEPAAATANLGTDLQPLLDQELSCLAEKHRTAIVLCELEGKSLREAARQLGVPQGTVASRLARGRVMLAKRLARRGLSVSAGALAALLARETATASVPGPVLSSTIKALTLLAAGQAATTGLISVKAAALTEGVVKGMLLTKLKIAMLVVLGFVVTGAGAGRLLLGTEAADNKVPPAASDKKTTAIGKVTGRVIHAADGKPVSGADVRLLRRGAYYGTPATRRITANAKGEFTFDDVAPGEYRIWSFHDNLASRTRMYQSDIVTVAPDGVAKPMALKMRPGITVRAKVLARKDGKPIAGARVRLIWTDTDRDRYTDKKGDVELPALTAETYHIEASAKDYAAVTQIVNLANEQPASLEMKLAPGGSVLGRVTGEDGKSVAKVGINVYGGAEGNTPLDYVETDANGRYRLDHLELRTTLKLYAAKLDYLSQTTTFSVDPAQRSARLDLVLKKRPHGGAIHGVVTDPQGKPVAGVEIFNTGGSSNEVRKTKTDMKGKYLLDDVYSDNLGHHLVARAKGLAPRRVEFRPGPASQPAEVNVQLEPGHRIKGRVVNEAGKPVPGVWVFFEHGDTPDGTYLGGRATTNAAGGFQFDSLPADTPFSFRAEGYSQKPPEKLPLDGDKEVVVTLKSQGMIKGRVVEAATGKPLRRFNVSITFSPDGRPDEPSMGLTSSRVSPGEEFTSSEGRFTLKDLTAGMPLQVSITASGYRRKVLRRVVAQAAMEATPLDIQVSLEDPAKLLTIRGKLMSHKGRPVRGADLRLIAATNRPLPRDRFPFNWSMIESGQIEQAAEVVQVQRLTSGADGSFLFQRVPGDVELELVYWGKGIPPGRMDQLEALSARERGNVQIKAGAPARVVGKIDREVFPRFSSIQLSGNARFYQAKVAADGKSFAIDDLPPGAYEVQIYGPAVREPGNPAAFQTPLIGRRRLTIEEGKEEKIDMGTGELVQNGSS